MDAIDKALFMFAPAMQVMSTLDSALCRNHVIDMGHAVKDT